MTEALDRRQQKTRAALQAAFRDLLLDDGYDDVTIASVAARANVGRSAFYEHYRTKDALLRASIQGPFVTLAGMVDIPPDTPPNAEAIENLLRHFRDNQQVARVLLGWPTRPVLASALTELIAARLHAMPLARPLIPAELIARQIAEAQLALIESWIAGRPALGMTEAVDGLTVATGALVKALCRT